MESLEARLALTAGTLDPNFGTDGKVLTDFTLPLDLPGNDSGRQVAIQQADGKIVLAGASQNFLVGARAIALARYNTDGSLDSDFGDEGRVRDQFAGFFEITGMALQADGRIVVVGYSSFGSTGSDFFLARFNTDGTRDTSFDGDGWLTTDFGGEELGHSVTMQADGKIVVAGYSFNEFTGTGDDFALARYNTNGSVDTGFGTGGLVTTDFGLGFNEHAFGVAVQPDGRIISAGEILTDTGTDFALARYSANGALDSGFGAGGLVTTDFGSNSDDHGTSIALQAGGKIVVAGYSNAGLIDYDFAVARYNSNGSLDAGFNGDGKVLTDIDRDHNFASSVAVQSTGKIVVAGDTHQDFAVARYNFDGSLDTGFSGDGKVTTDFAGNFDVAKSVVLQANGKIVAAGSADPDFLDTDFALARYDASGDLDGGFGTGGLVTTEFPVSFISLKDSGRQVAVQPDGKIVVAGTSNDEFIPFSDAVALARYNPDGSLDTTFGDNGQVWDNFLLFTEVSGLALQPDGKIVVAGTTLGLSTFTNDFFVARYNSDGTLDETFGEGGRITTNFVESDEFGGSDDQASSVAVQPDGKIVVAGTTAPDFTDAYDFALARYTNDGALDTDFGTSGFVITDFGSSADIAFSVAVQSDGKIVAAGSSVNATTISDFALARYDSSGVLDTAFGAGGLVTTDFNSSSIDIGLGMALQPDGKIVVAGVTGQEEGDFALARYDSSGALDTSFDSDGLVVTDLNSPGDWAFSVVVQPDGKLVAAGFSNQPVTGFDFALARYHANGALDASFGTGGWVTTDFGSPNDLGQGVALQADGKIVVAGLSEQVRTSIDFAVARYEGLFTGAVLEPDTCDPFKTQLVIGGTRGDDKIKITKVGNTDTVEVKLNGKSLGTFAPTGRIIVLGHAGDDDIQFSGNIANAAWLYGGAGDDRLNAGAGDDVLLGGEGDDLLNGGNGRDLLIGGSGSDRLVGNSDDDILISGTTDHDASEEALCQIMDEWTRSDAGFIIRVAHLQGAAESLLGTGKNGTHFLNSDTVHDDDDEDVLTGSSGNDWFFFNKDGDGNWRKKDRATDMSTFEALFAEDVDFIYEP